MDVRRNGDIGRRPAGALQQTGDDADRALLGRGPLLRRGVQEGVLTLVAILAVTAAQGQTERRPLPPPIASQPQVPQHRTRLYLRDGTYQTVLSYAVSGDRVQYRSAERGGATEEVPLSLVDLNATKAWAAAHDPNAIGKPVQELPVLSPELAREEAARAAQTPEVATDLRLPETGSVLVLDTFRGTPELVPMPQYGSDLNRETAHAIQKKDVNPAASPHDLRLLKDEQADVQLHVAEPVFYVRVRDTEGHDAGGNAFVVDTDGQAGATTTREPRQSEFAVEQLDVRQGARALSSFRMNLLGSGRVQPGVVSLREQLMPGGVWLKLTPVQPLEFGEYALVELLGERDVNLDVWDFGVHPTAKENDEALRPEVKRPAELERRHRDAQQE